MKNIVLAAAAVAVLGVPTLASAQGKMVFALVPKNMNNPFFDQARDGCKKAEAESGGKIECRYIGPGEHGGGDEQVKVVNEEYTPGAEEVEYARKVIRMDEEAAATGRGSFQIDGKMIDIPVVVRARNLIARHEAIRAREARTLAAMKG